jgi:hypothetical protein
MKTLRCTAALLLAFGLALDSTSVRAQQVGDEEVSQA